jgi:iron complex transport system permease protein
VSIPFDVVFKNILILQNTNNSYSIIIWQLRLPRILIAVLAGMALAGAGTAMQGIFRNPMADPYIIGISSGAAFGASIAIVMNSNEYVITLFSFIFGVTTAFIVYRIATKNRTTPVETLLLSGVAISAFLTALLSFIMYLHLGDAQTSKIFMWIMGSLANRNWVQVLIAFPIISIASIILYTYTKDLDLLLLGEEQAENLGLNSQKSKKIILLLSSIVTATAVSVCGIIGFIGLITPHMMRIIVGPSHRTLLPITIVSGAIFLLWMDTIARVINPPSEIPVGILTAIFGAPFFIYLLINRRNF